MNPVEQAQWEHPASGVSQAIINGVRRDQLAEEASKWVAPHLRDLYVNGG